MGGVWLCKQPSLSEGLDNVSSDEEVDNNMAEDDESTRQPQPTSPDHQPALSSEPSNNVTDSDDVFATGGRDSSSGSLDNSSTSESEDSPRTPGSEPPKWLSRAISICSEGGDLEVLASEADTDEYNSELHFPEAFASYQDQTVDDDRGTPEHPLESVTQRGNLGKENEDPEDNLRSEHKTTDTEQLCETQLEDNMNSLTVGPGSVPVEVVPVVRPTRLDVNLPSEDSTTADLGLPSLDTSQPFLSHSTPKKTVPCHGNQDYDILVDTSGKDYLYAAAHVIQRALTCEVDGQYQEAFSLYKSCVGLLLSGVQGSGSCPVMQFACTS